MKIVILGPAHPYRGGIAAFNDRLAIELLAEGHDVKVMTFTLQYPSFLFPGKTQFSPDPAPEGVGIERCLNSINPLTWFGTARKIRREHPDMLITRFWLPYMAPCLGTVCRLVRKAGIRTCAIVDNLIPHEKRPGDGIFIKYFCGSTDAFLAMSSSVLEDIKKVCPQKRCALAPHPLYDSYGESESREEALSRLGLPADRHYLLSFGLIRDYKGLDWLLEAYAGTDRSMPLIVAGEFYSDGEKYHSLARRLGIDELVIWRTEYIPDSEVRHYFCGASLVVQPYKSATQSGVTQIAYHFGKPMLVTDVGGLSEIVGNGVSGIVTEPSAKAVRDALNEFMAAPKDYSEGIAKQKIRFSWKSFCEKLLSLK